MDHAMTIYKDHIYVHGGRHHNNTHYSDVWKFNLSSNLWLQVSTTSNGGPPANREAGYFFYNTGIFAALFIYGFKDASIDVEDALLYSLKIGLTL